MRITDYKPYVDLIDSFSGFQCVKPLRFADYSDCTQCSECLKRYDWSDQLIGVCTAFYETWGKARDDVTHSYRKRIVAQNIDRTSKTLNQKWAYTVAFGTDHSNDPSHIVTYMERLIKKKKFSGGGSYVFEQRQKADGDAYGWHCHGVVKSSHPYSKLMQDFQETADGLKIPWVKGITFKLVKVFNDDFEKNYMTGNKFDEEKDPGVKNDLKFRQIYSLADIYTF